MCRDRRRRRSPALLAARRPPPLASPRSQGRLRPPDSHRRRRGRLAAHGRARSPRRDPAGPRYALRLLIARPSRSRTVGSTRSSSGKFRSAMRRRITATCWASFCPKYARSGCDDLEELGHDGRHPAEVSRTSRRFQPFGEHSRRLNVGGEARGIHLIGGRGEDRVDAHALQQGEVARQIAWIAREVFGGAGLRGIDEDAGDDDIGFGAATPWRARGARRASSPSSGRTQAA